jgi:phosphatidylserine decarboxylase
LKTKQRLQTKLEECRQALAIHGGAVNFCAASLAVRLSRVKIPSRRLRDLIYRNIYGKKYPPLDESELEHSLASYPSLNALFTRGIRPEFRPISQTKHQFLCPCDGQIQEVGRLQEGKLLTVKGIDYTVRSLMAGEDAGRFRDGHYAIFFLSPRDCHRVFSPQGGQCRAALHVPGYRLLVHPPFQRREFPTFTLNERIILSFSTPLGECALILVAGWGVGNITLAFDQMFRIKKNRRIRKNTITRRCYSPPVEVRKGEWLATFELGSTVILLTEATKGVRLNVAVADAVKYGQPVFSCAD